MADQLLHRGPDDGGIWADEQAGIALGFRRLSIVDLSPAGHQPMFSPSGRYVIAFNGEVYNFLELRDEIESRNISFRGHSDTEVMLAAIEEWGLETAIRKFVGMFAFSLWDRQERTLHLVRDRIGIKPLYYYLKGNILVFGSELKALRAHPSVLTEVDRNALALFFRYQYIPQPFSILSGVQKLPPGCILSVKDNVRTSEYSTECRPYWSARDVAAYGVSCPFGGTEQQALEEFDELLRKAVRLRMIADVPLGAFLSGGIDSSLIVSLMQAQSDRPIKTFTIGFHEDQYNEAKYARKVAAHLGTDHTELYLKAEQAFEVIPKLPSLYDEPFADSSQIPTFLVSLLARRHVTVSLSGDGGDELCGGYDRYFLAQSIWGTAAWIPYPIRSCISQALHRITPRDWDRIFDSVRRLMPSRVTSELRGSRVHTFAKMLAARDQYDFYRQLISCWKVPTELVHDSVEPIIPLTDPLNRGIVPTFLQRMMFLDLLTYLPDCILTKVDRASMGVSLEARVPLLDHRLVEFAARLPIQLKIRSGNRKWLLKQILYRYVPKELVERRKMGFGIPIGSWLRGPLRNWAEDLLDERRIREDGYLNPEPIRKVWADHLTGDRNWGPYLWTVLMFNSWLDYWKKVVPRTDAAPMQLVWQ